jgi:acyl-CoA reductase-like NAD-dependent aldehyde dehydrogenase
MITMKEETFGPVMPIMKVSSDEEAVALMNDSDYGLTASVWTKDMAKGEELIDQIEAGTVFINRCDYPAPVRIQFELFHRNQCSLAHRTWPGRDGRPPVLDVPSDHGDTTAS